MPKRMRSRDLETARGRWPTAALMADVPRPVRRPGGTAREQARLLVRERRPRVRLGGHRTRRATATASTDRVAADIVRPARTGRAGPQGARHHGRQPVLLLLRARQREPAEDVRRERPRRPDAAVLRQLLRAPRLRLRRRRPRRHQPLRRLRGRRRPLRHPLRQGRRRLARTAAASALHHPHRQHTGQGGLDQRPHRHDRQELGRHHRQRRRRHRRRGPEDHRPDQRHLLLVRLLLRPGRPALRLRPRRARPTTSRAPDAQRPVRAPSSRRSSTAPRAPATGRRCGPSATT